MSFPPITEYESPELYSTLFSETLYKMDYLNPQKEWDLNLEDPKNILIIAISPVSDSDQALLIKILKSIKLELSDVHFLKIHEGFRMNFPRILKILNPQKCILFGSGSEFLKIPDHWKKYTILELGLTYFILADPLTSLETDPDKSLKNLLWIQLKQLFLSA